MATPELWQPISRSVPPQAEWCESAGLSFPNVIAGGLAHRSPSEVVDQLPAIPLLCLSASGRIVKRALDLIVSSLALLLLSPVLLVIALAVQLDSPGPVFYTSERVGKNGRIFCCFKFRTMVRDAERRQQNVMHLNERDAVLFKASSDPRVTRVGRLLRRYSLDELPQFLNVLRGDMSVVGPRPPVAGEVREYSSKHLRRLDVLPGITGLWQIQGRHDPSFESYVSLDIAYIENWSIALDLKIMAQTAGVVLSGTGT
jgi:exopolysaccharide biosynthesis polyprenyl glycosylphosphotransferase